ncbi:hypothetical protein [Allomesorhizobium camelthorni]|uniref:Uncharacterized protein n=1 Tax=Allomesorhizobium camelthorni TaxID=475069 RepID=A0A6G4WPF3_9HYPH|nr:hypothetical protein [Mesorhizobium camelthorni]NGO55990.1 hypothetical protein [Mesorhizobium camelthorni]
MDTSCQNTISGLLRPPRTETVEHTITGLLAKRADLFNEAERIRDRLAEIKNDIGALDRTLNVLGYAGDLDAAMPRQKREVSSAKASCPARSVANCATPKGSYPAAI